LLPGFPTGSTGSTARLVEEQSFAGVGLSIEDGGTADGWDNRTKGLDYYAKTGVKGKLIFNRPTI
jgi:hypothetical protein